MIDKVWFEHVCSGVLVYFPKDLEGVIGDSPKVRERNLVATEHPAIIQSEDRERSEIYVLDEEIPKEAVAYSSGRVVMGVEGLSVPITYFRKKHNRFKEFIRRYIRRKIF